MAQTLHRDKEFHDFVCESGPCNLQEFLTSVRFEDATLRNDPRVEGCFVRPEFRRTETLTGVFALEPGGPRLLLTYYGIDIGLDRNWHGTGYRDLIGSARGSEGGEPIWLTHRFEWRKNNYMETESKRVTE
jgi:hypothetical protein